MDRNLRPALFAIAIIGIGAPIVAVLAATRWGIGISPDSISYIGGARSLLAGNGFSMPGTPPAPITHFPPLYSLVLAAVGTMGPDPLTGARWLGALLFAGNVLAVGWLLASLDATRTRAFDMVALLGMVLMLASVTMLEIHSMAWTEPAFVLLGLLGFAALARWLETERWSMLALSAMAFGLAFLTRYAAVAYLGTALAAIVLLSRRRWTARVAPAVTFALIAIVPIAAWIARNAVLGGTTTNRTLYLHLPPMTLVWEALATLSSWVLLPLWLPASVRALLLCAAATAVGLLYVFERRTHVAGSRWSGDATNRPPALLQLFMLFLPAYAATLIFSNSVLRAYTPMEGRILSPVFPALLIVVMHACRRLLSLARDIRLVRPVIAGLGGILAGLSLLQGAAYVHRGYDEGLGFNARSWRQSDTLAHLRALPVTGTATIYSNAPEAIYIHLGRPSERLPRPVLSATGVPNPNYAAELAEMQKQLDRGALIVLFEHPSRRSRGTEESLERLDVPRLLELEDGTIYGAVPAVTPVTIRPATAG